VIASVELGVANRVTINDDEKAIMTRSHPCSLLMLVEFLKLVEVEYGTSLLKWRLVQPINSIVNIRNATRLLKLRLLVKLLSKITLLLMFYRSRADVGLAITV
jgi:hypothetical protein